MAVTLPLPPFAAVIPVRQHQLINPDGSLADQLLVASSGSDEAIAGDIAGFGPGSSGVKLLSNSLVLQTGGGTYIQVGGGWGGDARGCGFNKWLQRHLGAAKQCPVWCDLQGCLSLTHLPLIQPFGERLNA